MTKIQDELRGNARMLRARAVEAELQWLEKRGLNKKLRKIKRRRRVSLILIDGGKAHRAATAGAYWTSLTPAARDVWEQAAILARDEATR
jgi:hypothetical protein